MFWFRPFPLPKSFQKRKPIATTATIVKMMPNFASVFKHPHPEQSAGDRVVMSTCLVGGVTAEETGMEVTLCRGKASAFLEKR